MMWAVLTPGVPMGSVERSHALEQADMQLRAEPRRVHRTTPVGAESSIGGAQIISGQKANAANDFGSRKRLVSLDEPSRKLTPLTSQAIPLHEIIDEFVVRFREWFK